MQARLEVPYAAFQFYDLVMEEEGAVLFVGALVFSVLLTEERCPVPRGLLAAGEASHTRRGTEGRVGGGGCTHDNACHTSIIVIDDGPLTPNNASQER